jgi:hypothetical protein
VDDSSSPLGWEAPTAAANLVILLIPEGNWPAVGNSPGTTPIVLAGPLPAERQVLPAADPEFATCYHAEMPALIGFLINAEQITTMPQTPRRKPSLSYSSSGRLYANQSNGFGQ